MQGSTSKQSGASKSNPKTTDTKINKSMLGLTKVSMLFSGIVSSILFWFGEGNVLEGCQVAYQDAVCYSGMGDGIFNGTMEWVWGGSILLILVLLLLLPKE